MKARLTFIKLIAVSLICVVPAIPGNDSSALAADYFISTQADFDTYKNATFAPGDNILFEKGKTFNGMFAPTNVGAPGNVITISTFGTGPQPIINNHGVLHLHPTRSGATVSAGVLLFNAEYVELRGLEVTDIDDLADAHDFAGTHRLNAITNLYAAHNWVGNTGRNTVIARDSDYAVYEYNTSANSSRHDTGHSFFNFRTLGIIFQYNEAYGNTGVGNESDRGGFDADSNSKDTTIQYNYSHNNDWFAGIMKRRNTNVTIRYNLSVNDNKGAYFFGFENNTSVSNLDIYNNTHYFDSSISPEIIALDRTPHETAFNNNIFYAAGSGTMGIDADNGTNVIYDTNVYYNVTLPVSETNALTADPLLVSPGAEPYDIDMEFGRDALAGYMLSANSPYVDSGISISNNGGFDFWGNPEPTGGTDIGASEVGGSGGAGPGATILTGDPFPDPGGANVIAATPSTPGINGDDASLSLTQTFQVGSAFDLRTIFLDYKYDPLSNPSANAINVEIFEVDDVGASTITPGTALLTLTGLEMPELAAGDEAAIVLESTFNLPETAGTEGYALRITNGGNPGFEWHRTGSTAGSVYALGKAYENGVEKVAGERDFVLALSGIVFLLGDANDDGILNNLDIASFDLALFDPVAYAVGFPDVDPDVVLDTNTDGVFNNLDISAFGAALGF